jgi:hypothetical protein
MGSFAKLSKKFLSLFHVTTSWARGAGASEAELSSAQAQPAAPSLTVLAAKGNCARCGFNRANGGQWRDASDEQQAPSVCSIRGLEITHPLTTYCRSCDSRDPALFGATFTILPSHDNLCAPWVGLSAPRESEATCCICGWETPYGILIRLPEAEVGACGPEHYLAWWTDFQSRRLAFFKALGEKAYSDMYDVIGYSASGYYSNAKDAFHDAISTACDLELINEMHALKARLEHIQNVSRSQFR